MCSWLLFSVVAVAQNSNVQISTLLLTRQARGWRVGFTDDSAHKYSLERDDLLTEIDGVSGCLLGPLAITRKFNDAFLRTVPLAVQRGSKLLTINLWRSDGAAPPPLRVPPKSARCQ